MDILDLNQPNSLSLCVCVCVTDVCGCLAVLLCCLTAGVRVEDEVLQALLATVMEWRSSQEDWFLFSR